MRVGPYRLFARMYSERDETLGKFLSTSSLNRLAAQFHGRKLPGITVTVAVVAGVAIAAILLAVWLRPIEHRAEARVLIVPAQTSGDIPVTSLDTLSRGTVVETFAQVFASEKIRLEAFEQGQLPAASTEEDVTIETSVLAGTSIVRVIAKSRDAEKAEEAADVLAGYRPNLAGYSAAFQPLPIAFAAGTAEQAGPSRLLLSAALVIAALINAFGVIVFLRRRGARATASPALRPLETEKTRPKVSAQR